MTDDEQVLPPAPRPCASCPYRADVPSGVWSAAEYALLPDYDQDTPWQPTGVFLCHQAPGRMCAGWVGCHDMAENLALRLAMPRRDITAATYAAALDYTSPVPLFASGAEAAAHGMVDVDHPGPAARALIDKISTTVPHVVAHLASTQDTPTPRRRTLEQPMNRRPAADLSQDQIDLEFELASQRAAYHRVYTTPGTDAAEPGVTRIPYVEESWARAGYVPASPADMPIPFDGGYGHRIVVGFCLHAVAVSEWAAGFRTCERCVRRAGAQPAVTS